MRKKSAWRILAGFLAAVFALTAMPERALAAGEASAETAYEAEAAEEAANAN